MQSALLRKDQLAVGQAPQVEPNIEDSDVATSPRGGPEIAATEPRSQEQRTPEKASLKVAEHGVGADPGKKDGCVKDEAQSKRGVLEFDIEAFKSFFLSIHFMLELSWAAGHYRGNKLIGKKNV